MANLNRSFLENPLAPEFGWFYGVMLGDGNVYIQERSTRPGEIDYSVSVSGSISTTSRWGSLVASGNAAAPHKFSRANAWQLVLHSKELAEWFRDKHGICGPKSASLEWPEWLTHHTKRHFIRGLWDTDGSIHFEEYKTHKYPAVSFASNSREFVERLRSELEDELSLEPVTVSGHQKPRGDGSLCDPNYKLKYRGPQALKILDYLYANAAEHIRNEDRYHKYLDVKFSAQNVTEAKCHVCGDSANSREPGSWCRKCLNIANGQNITGDGTHCSCGNGRPILAGGLCLPCYHRNRRAAPDYKRPISGKCAGDGCGKEASLRKGLCDACYSAQVRADRKVRGIKEKQYAPKAKGPCRDQGCDGSALKKGLCMRHYRAVRKAVSTFANPKPPKTKLTGPGTICVTCSLNPVFSTGNCKSCYDKAAYRKKQAAP